GKENGVNILKSIDEGPFQMGIFQETLAEGNEGALHLGPERAQIYFNLSPEDKERYNTDIRAINILLQGLSNDIYTLINHYIDAKDIWDNVKMLLEASELTKKRPFVTAMKLNRGLKESNYDQLYAYLKQYEVHANENKMILERFTQHTVNPLALMSNVSPQQYSSQSSTTPPSTHVPSVTYQPHFTDNTQVDLRLSLINNLIKNLTNTLSLLIQSYKTYLPQTNNQLSTPSNIRNQATVQDDTVVVQNVQGRQNRVQGNNPRGASTTGNREAHNRVGNANLGQARQIKYYNYNAQENGVVLDEEQLLFLAGGHDTTVDEDVDESPVHEYVNYQDAVCEHYDAYKMHHDVQPNCIVDSNANYTSDSNMITYDQYVQDNTAQSISVNKQNKVVNASLTAELATYKEQVELYERRAKFELTKREQKIEEQLRIVIIDRNINEEYLKKELHSVKMQLNSTINHNKSMVEEVTSLKKDFKQKENKYLKEFWT
ncbi:hypothetical protein Tco_0543516, partial [Tanacetum coccineum]